jgi:hypothetical protein
MAEKKGCTCDTGDLLLHINELLNTTTELQHFEHIVGGRLNPEDNYQLWGANIEMAEQELLHIEKECNISLKEERELLDIIEQSLDKKYDYKQAASLTEDLIRNIRLKDFCK